MLVLTNLKLSHKNHKQIFIMSFIYNNSLETQHIKTRDTVTADTEGVLARLLYMKLLGYKVDIPDNSRWEDEDIKSRVNMEYLKLRLS